MKRWAAGVAGLLTAGAGALLYATWIERTRVKLDHFTVEVPGPGLPDRGLAILHLSDFHFSSDGCVQDIKVARLDALLATEQYDLVALTGDLIHDMRGLPVALSLIRRLRPRHGIYFCPGNHDYAEYTPWGVFGKTWHESAAGGFGVGQVKRSLEAIAAFVRKVLRNELVRMPVAFNDVPAIIQRLQAAGVVPLVNKSYHLGEGDVDIWLAGVDDEMESRPDLAAALDGVPSGAPLVLLAHNPDIWLQCGVDRAALVLSGHTHGGQIQLPGLGAIHTQGTHLPRSRPAGWFERGRSRMFVSRGLGESIPLRFGAGPQAAIIRLVPSVRSSSSRWK